MEHSPNIKRNILIKFSFGLIKMAVCIMLPITNKNAPVLSKTFLDGTNSQFLSLILIDVSFDELKYL